MLKTMNTIHDYVSNLTTTCVTATKVQRADSFKIFTTDTLSMLSASMQLNSKASNDLTSAYGVRDAFANALNTFKAFALEDEKDAVTIDTWAKVTRHAVAMVSRELKAVDTAIYATYEPLKKNDVQAFAKAFNELVGVPCTDVFFNFMRAYMFSVSKELSRKAYARKFVDLLTAMKVYQGNFSLKMEKVSMKRIFNDISVSTLNPDAITTYEDLKAFVSESAYAKELVNNNMFEDMKVLKKAKKDVLVLTAEEYAVYQELKSAFKK